MSVCGVCVGDSEFNVGAYFLSIYNFSTLDRLRSFAIFWFYLFFIFIIFYTFDRLLC